MGKATDGKRISLTITAIYVIIQVYNLGKQTGCNKACPAAMDQNSLESKMPLLDKTLRKPLFAGLGMLFFLVGLAGAVLPVLPTTPFMLLAVWAFSNSSQRLHDYVWHHPRHGPLVRAWKEHGAIPGRAKFAALLVMLASAVFLIFFSSVPVWAVTAAVLLMLAGAAFILSRPTLAGSSPSCSNRS